jgi:hypothetical protein
VALKIKRAPIERKIPHSIEGHPVRIEVSGVIRPMRQQP